jgi:hypothetical protein
MTETGGNCSSRLVAPARNRVAFAVFRCPPSDHATIPAPLPSKRVQTRTMTDLPSGTVTFLFTDIGGSRRLWERDRAAMHVAVERHLALLRGASRRPLQVGGRWYPVGLSHGRRCSRRGPRPPANILCRAVARSARTTRRTDGAPCGCGCAAPWRLSGGATNRLARLLGLARGGQILLTEAVVHLVHETTSRLGRACGTWVSDGCAI